MKRIVLSCRVNFTLRGKEEKKVFTFEKGQPYEVEDGECQEFCVCEGFPGSSP